MRFNVSSMRISLIHRCVDACMTSYQVSALVAITGLLAVNHQPKAVAVHLQASTFLAVAADRLLHVLSMGNSWWLYMLCLTYRKSECKHHRQSLGDNQSSGRRQPYHAG